MGKNKVKKNPGKKGKRRQEVSGGEHVKENNPFEDVKENTPFKLSEMVTTGSEVTVLAGKGVEVLSNNNNNVSKEDALKEEDCGKEKKKKESINWQPREKVSKGLADDKEGSKFDERDEELKLEDSPDLNKLDCSEVNKLKDTSDFSDSSGFQEMSSSLLERQESQHMSSGVNSSLLENSNASFGPNDDLNQGFIDCSFEERIEAQGGQQRKSKKSKAPHQQQRSNQSYPTIEDFVKAGVSRRIAMMKHPLENTWTFWYQKSDPKLCWEAQAQRVVDVATVEDFWQVYHHLEPAYNLREGQDYLLFKKGISPDWSDPLNMQGGRLIVNMRREEGGQFNREEVLAGKERLETMWVELLLLLIGEQAGAEAALINGAAVNVKKKTDRLAVWLKQSSNMEAVITVGKLVKERLQLEAGTKQVYFQAHDHGCLDNTKKRNNSGYNPSPAKTFI